MNLIFGGEAVDQGRLQEWRPPLASITAGRGPRQDLQLAPAEVAREFAGLELSFSLQPRAMGSTSTLKLGGSILFSKVFLHGSQRVLFKPAGSTELVLEIQQACPDVLCQTCGEDAGELFF